MSSRKEGFFKFEFESKVSNLELLVFDIDFG